MLGMCSTCQSKIIPRRHERRSERLIGDAPHPASKQKDRIQRADIFEVPANIGKTCAVRALWTDWRRGLLAEALVARRDLKAGRQLRERLYADAEAAEPLIAASKKRLGAAPQQMVRAQAVGAIRSWLGNRKNDVSDAIQAQFNPRRWGGKAKRRFEVLPDDRRSEIEAEFAELRHELSAINKQRLWMAPGDLPVMRKLDNDQLVPVSDRARRLARTIFLGIASRHKWPRFAKMAMRIDSRLGHSKIWLEPAKAGLFAWWLNLKTPAGKIALPVRGWGRGENEAARGAFRKGILGKTVNLVGDADGTLRIMLNRDVTEVFTQSRDGYEPLVDVLAIDFGLNTLLATSEGDLLGRRFKEKLLPLATRATKIAGREQQAGRKPRDCPAYRDLITRMRGLIDTEVNRALNHAVKLHRPRVLAVEKLDFRGMGLSRRLNRILSNCGRGAVEKKLDDLAERYGIEIHEVDPAYTSQTCSCCGYADKRQRNEEKFHCRHCGKRMHADVNGARNIAQAIGQASEEVAGNAGGCSVQRATPTGRPQRRKRKTSSLSRTRSASLRQIVRRFDERMADLKPVSRPRRGSSGARESAPDPRLNNPYWKRYSLLLKRKSAAGQNLETAAFAVAT